MQRQMFCLEKRSERAMESHVSCVTGSSPFYSVDTCLERGEEQPEPLLWSQGENISKLCVRSCSSTPRGDKPTLHLRLHGRSAICSDNRDRNGEMLPALYLCVNALISEGSLCGSLHVLILHPKHYMRHNLTLRALGPCTWSGVCAQLFHSVFNFVWCCL